jgi:hypothetical protein
MSSMWHACMHERTLGVRTEVQRSMMCGGAPWMDDGVCPSKTTNRLTEPTEPAHESGHVPTRPVCTPIMGHACRRYTRCTPMHACNLR